MDYQDLINLDEDRMPRVMDGVLRVFYKGGGKPNIPKPIPVARPDLNTEIEISKRSMRDRMAKARGLASTRLTQPGSLTGETTLKQTLG